jgi:hypothetical protein
MPFIALVVERVNIGGRPPAIGCAYTLNTPLASDVISSRLSSAENDAPKMLVVSKKVRASYTATSRGECRPDALHPHATSPAPIKLAAVNFQPNRARRISVPRMIEVLRRSYPDCGIVRAHSPGVKRSSGSGRCAGLQTRRADDPRMGRAPEIGSFLDPENNEYRDSS